MVFICPRCGMVPLEPTVRDDAEVHVCARCGGLWGRPLEGSAPAGEMEGVSAARAPLDCPEGHGALQRLSVRGVDLLQVDHCASCAGIWFDHQEWDHLEALRVWQAHRAASEGPTPWRVWWFQFLLQVPVEYNVKPRGWPVVTSSLVIACLLAYGLVPSAAHEALAVVPARGGPIPTFLSYAFLHANPMHLVGNLYFLWILGDNVEDVLGRRRYAALFAIGAAGSAVAFVALHPSSAVPLVGASGAVAAIMAAYLVLFRDARLTMMLVFWQRKLPAFAWIGLWLALQIAGVAWERGRDGVGVAFSAHLMGFLVGLLLILPFRRRLLEAHPLLHLLETRRIAR